MARYQTRRVNQDLDLKNDDMNAPFIAPIVEQMQYKNMKEESVREQIVAFFKAYDDYKEEQVVRMQT